MTNEKPRLIKSLTRKACIVRVNALVDKRLSLSFEISFKNEVTKFNAIMENCSAVSSWLIFYQHKVPFAVFLLILSPVSILLNLSLITSFIATRQVTRNSSNIFIFVLSLYDLTTGAIYMPLMASILLDFDADDSCIKARVLVSIVGSGHASCFFTVLLAVDRYLHMNPDIQSRPSRIAIIFKKPNIYYLIATANIFFLSVFTIVAFNFNSTLTFTLIAFFTDILAAYVLIITCLYIKGYLRIRKFADNNPVYEEPVGSARSTPDYVRKLYKTVLVLIVLAFLHYIPICVVHIAAISSFPVLDEKTARENIVYSYFFELAMLSSSAGCITNCIAVFHFNLQAKTWILNKIGKREVTNHTISIE